MQETKNIEKNVVQRRSQMCRITQTEEGSRERLRSIKFFITLIEFSGAIRIVRRLKISNE